MNSPKCRLSLLLAALVLMTGGLPAQGGPCFGDDGFNVGCCGLPTPNLPAFPPITSAALYGCFLGCNLDQQFQAGLTISAPNFLVCDLATVSINVMSGGPVGPNFGGVLLAKYDRTWLEILTTGGFRQVWRFMVNGDVNYLGTAAAGFAVPCPTPTCVLGVAGTITPVHYTGHIDYAIDCPSTGTIGNWSFAVNLNHVTGCINHNAFSARPMVAPFDHADRTYSLVAPANFVFGPVPVPQGPLFGEDVRSAKFDNVAPFYHCLGEAPVVNFGGVNTAFVDCFCSPVSPVTPPIWHHQNIAGGVSCGPLTVINNFNTIPLPPALPTGMVTMAIGSYVGINPNAFPTGRQISLSYGVMGYNDPCIMPDTPFYVFTGVGHVGGSTAVLFGSPVIAANVSKFIDLQSMEFFSVSSSGAFVLSPGIGALFLPRKVWNLNPF